MGIRLTSLRTRGLRGLLLLAAACSLSQWLHAKEFVQTGAAMEPTIKDGARIEVSLLGALVYEPSRFDVVLYRDPDRPDTIIVGRIIGMPHESIDIRDDGVYINRKLLELTPEMVRNGIKYVKPYEAVGGGRIRGDVYRTKDERYFMLGDNSMVARDSRFFGPVSREHILNKVEGK